MVMPPEVMKDMECYFGKYKSSWFIDNNEAEVGCGLSPNNY